MADDDVHERSTAGADAAPAILTPASAPSEPAAPQAVRGAARRLAARFALLAFGLYHLPLMLNNYPSLGGGQGGTNGGMAVAWGHVFCQVGLWLARHVLHLTGPMPEALSGDNGDTVEEYCRLVAGVAVALVAAVIWTIADRRRPGARWVEGALHVLLRYSIAIGVASYAIAKIFPQQFFAIPVWALDMRVGEQSPMSLLWRFMEYSRPYSTFGGVMEMVVVVLLCFRRTALLGALVCVSVMLNVMLMNVCYDVVVKLYSTMTLVSALVLVLYDAPDLVRMLVFRRAVPARPVAPPFRSPRLNQARWLVKLVLVGGVIWSSVATTRENVSQSEAAERAPLFGRWEVTSHVVGGRELAQTTEPARWRAAAIDFGRLALRLEDGSRVVCVAESDDAAHTLKLSCADTKHEAALHWARDGEQLRLDGTFDGIPVTAVLRQLGARDVPLLQAPFHWTMDG